MSYAGIPAWRVVHGRGRAQRVGTRSHTDLLVMTGLWGEWTWEPFVVVGVAMAGGCYAAGLRRLWRQAGTGRAVGRKHAWIFAAGLLAAALAVVSPLDTLGDALFSAHMTQHLVLILIAAPLLVLGRPLIPFLWALPRSWRRRAGRWWAAGPTTRIMVGALTLPSVVWVAHMAALGFWHVPGPYGWAFNHEWVHALEHASFLFTGCLFWWVVFQPTGRRRLGYGAAVLYGPRSRESWACSPPCSHLLAHPGTASTCTARRRGD